VALPTHCHASNFSQNLFSLHFDGLVQNIVTPSKMRRSNNSFAQSHEFALSFNQIGGSWEPKKKQRDYSLVSNETMCWRNPAIIASVLNHMV